METISTISTILMVLLICFGCLAGVYLAICLIIMPHQIYKMRLEMRESMLRQTALLGSLVTEALRHTNASVDCPTCKAKIHLVDGRGTCESCGQQVKA